MKYSTDQIKKVMDECNGNQTKAAALLGIPRTTLQYRLSCNQIVNNPIEYEAKLTNDADPSIKGLSTYYDYIDDKTGERKRGWIKTQKKLDEKASVFTRIAEQFKSDILRLPEIVLQTNKSAIQYNLVTEYILTDAHIGMRSWAKETGADWDINIAKETILRCFEELVSRTPNSQEAVFISLGDNMHYDSHEAVTPTNGHLLDVDSRYLKMTLSTRDIMRECIDMIAKKHHKVTVIVMEGNHDISSAEAMRIILNTAYESNHRIDVPLNVNVLHALKYGDVMLSYHHGHLVKPGNLPSAMFQEFPSMCGKTKFRFGASGHEHHYEEFDKDGFTWRKMSTIAARDAYASRHGYNATRSAIATTYDYKEGRIGYVQKNILT